MKKTKYFNKNMYETENKIKTAFIILVMFLLGLFIGVAINYMELQNKEQQIREYQVEVDSQKQTLDTVITEKDRLETKLNNYTIEERRTK